MPGLIQRIRFPAAYPPRGLILGALVAAYLLLGLFGHDPWKSDDAVHFGVVHSLLESGEWLDLRLAGERFGEYPALYYWVAAAFAKGLGWLLPVHDAARLASALFAALAFAAVGGTARRLYNGESFSAAVLLSIGTLGFTVHLHETQPVVAVVAGQAFALLGLATLGEGEARSALRGALLAGAGLALAFVAGGAGAALLILPLWLILPLASPAWRSGRVVAALAGALLLGLAAAAAYPALLASRAPGTLAVWYQAEAEDLTLQGSLAGLRSIFAMLPWFAWPALPVALWALWAGWGKWREAPLALPLAAFVTALAVFVLGGTRRAPELMPLLPPLILLGASGAGTLRRGAANALDWFAMMALSLLAALVWLGWSALALGWPPRLARQALRLTPGFEMETAPVALALAVVLTLGWLWLIFASPRSPHRATVHWAAGTLLFWALTMSLWGQWIDYGKSYRPVSASLAQALEKQRKGCIAGAGLGDSQRASFHYFDGIVTRPAATPEAAPCRLLLVQSTGKNAPEVSPGPGWRKAWEGRRPGDRHERFRLYSRPG